MTRLPGIRRFYFIGAKQEELEKSVAQIRRSYPRMAVAGYRNGYFLDVDDRRRAIRDIVDSGADFAIVGMGAPLQEQFALVCEMRDSRVLCLRVVVSYIRRLIG